MESVDSVFGCTNEVQGGELAPAGDVLVGLDSGRIILPRLIADAGEQAGERYVEFFTAKIRNPNTRRAYGRAVADFCVWCEEKGFRLDQLRTMHLAAYAEILTRSYAAPTAKQRLAALRMFFDWLVVGQVVGQNPAAAVRGPKHVVKKGKTPVLTADETRILLDSIPLKIGPEPEPGVEDKRPPSLIGLRDRAIIATMAYSFARVGAMLAMTVEDYYTQGRRGWLRLHEKGGKEHDMPAHHNLEAYIDAYVQAAGIAEDRKGVLFRSNPGWKDRLTENPMTQPDVWRMIRRRAKRAGIKTLIGCHSFRATGITVYLENGGTLERAQAMANHESPKTTKLYDRTSDQITLDEVERIVI
jgi:site-specific recombinase XerD